MSFLVYRNTIGWQLQEIPKFYPNFSPLFHNNLMHIPIEMSLALTLVCETVGKIPSSWDFHKLSAIQDCNIDNIAICVLAVSLLPLLPIFVDLWKLRVHSVMNSKTNTLGMKFLILYF